MILICIDLVEHGRRNWRYELVLEQELYVTPACERSPVGPSSVDQIKERDVGYADLLLARLSGNIAPCQGTHQDTYIGIIATGMVRGMPKKHRTRRFLCRDSRPVLNVCRILVTLSAFTRLLG